MMKKRKIERDVTKITKEYECKSKCVMISTASRRNNDERTIVQKRIIISHAHNT